MFLSTLKRLNAISGVRNASRTTWCQWNSKPFSVENNSEDFMEKFARSQFQQPVNKKAEQQGQAFLQRKRQRQPTEEPGTQDLLQAAYLREFGKKKGDLLQDWLEMSGEEIIIQCRKFQTPVSEKLNENIQGLFGHLNKFESEMLAEANNVQVPTPVLDGVFKKFGMKKQEQMDKWLELPNADLMAECQKYGLSVSEKHIHNIQTLFNYLKLFDTAAAKQKPIKRNEPAEVDDQNRNQSKQFHRKGDKQTWDQQAQSEAAQTEVDAELSKIFNRKNSSDQLKTIQKQRNAQQEEESQIRGPIQKLPQAPSMILNLVKQIQNKQGSYLDIVTPQGTSERAMQIEQINFAEILANQQKQSEDVDKIFQMNPDLLVQHYEELRGSNQLEEFRLLTNIQKRTTLVNMTSIQKFKLQANPDEQIKTLEHQVGGLLTFASDNFALLNGQSRSIVKEKLIQILSATENTFLNAYVTSVKHLNALVTLISKFGISNLPMTQSFYQDQLIQNNQVFVINKKQPFLDQICDLSNAVAQLDEQSNKLVREKLVPSIQEQFQESGVAGLLKNELTPAKLQKMSIQQAANLTYLCRGADYLGPLLKKICHSGNLAELSNKKIIYVVERAIDLNKKSELSPLMSGITSQVNGRRFNLSEIQTLFTQLSRLGKQADSQLYQNFVDPNQKLFVSVPTSEELKQSLDILLSMYKSQPYAFSKARGQMRILVLSTSNLTSREVVPLREMVRLATLLAPSTSNPTFMLKDIVESTESLGKDVSEQEAGDLVDAIMGRIQQHRVSFDHLKHSKSIIHSQFLPYTGQTFELFKKVLEDDVSCKITNKILSDSFVVSRLFTNQEQAEKSFCEHLNKQIEDLKVAEPNMKSYQDIFHVIGNFMQIVPGGTVEQLSRQLLETTLIKINESSKSVDCGITNFEELLETNSAIMKAIFSFQSYEDLLLKYRDQIWFAKTIERNLRQKMGLQQTTDDRQPLISPQVEQQISASAANLSWSQLERQSSHLMKHFLVHLSSQSCATQEMSQLVHQYLVRLHSSRSLHNEDLTNLFLLVDKIQPGLKNQGDFDHLLMNVASNLRTIGVNLMQISPEKISEPDLQFTNQNANNLERERTLKKMILSKYLQIYERNPALFSDSQQFSLAPLSNLMAQLFDTFEHQDVLNCMNLLTGTKIDNYAEEFIMKLYENYAQQAFMAQMYDSNPKFFFEFSKAWPQFLRNNAILNQLTRVKGQSVLVSDQSETLQILTRRNVLHPELMNLHLDTFIRMKDRDQVAKYLNQFLESAAYFGYTNNVNIEQITQVFRRIHKSPSECNMEELLNFLVVLAISNTYYGDFDEKSKLFIDSALDFVENSTISQQYVQGVSNQKGAAERQYTGTQHLVATRPRDVKGSDAAETSSALQSEQEFKLSFFQQIPTSNKTYNKQAVVNTTKEIVEETERARTAHFQIGAASLSDQEDIEESQSIDQLEEKSIDIEAVGEQVSSDDENFGRQQKTTRKSYERKGSESQYQEDYEYLQFRNKKLAQMNKKDKHLLMYSNVNQLNFVDINQQSVAKAWTILFHFRAKSLQSMLFEEFNSITQRNAVGKTKSHELFSKLYLKLMEESYESGLVIQMANSCDRTGWPIDISLRLKQPVAGKVDHPHAIYFLLQEELCYNAQTQAEEPLGLQKLMVRHLQTISDYKVHYVTENEAQTSMESVVERLIEQINE